MLCAASKLNWVAAVDTAPVTARTGLYGARHGKVWRKQVLHRAILNLGHLGDERPGVPVALVPSRVWCDYPESQPLAHGMGTISMKSRYNFWNYRFKN